MSCSIIKNRNGKLAQREEEMRKIWKEYIFFLGLYNIDTQEEVAVTCVALTEFIEVTSSEESQLEELRLR